MHALVALQARHRAVADWLWVYGAELHVDEPCVGSSQPCGRPASIHDRARLACAAAHDLNVPSPIVLDHTAAGSQCTNLYRSESGLVVVVDHSGIVLRVFGRYACRVSLDIAAGAVVQGVFAKLLTCCCYVD